MVEYTISNDCLSLRAHAIFQKLSSYCNCQLENLDIVLQHEQIQFDIGEKNCRLLKRAVTQMSKKTINEHAIDSVVNYFNTAAEIENQIFIYESGKRQKIEKTWQMGASKVNEQYKKRIFGQINELAKFSSPDLKILIK